MKEKKLSSILLIFTMLVSSVLLFGCNGTGKISDNGEVEGIVIYSSEENPYNISEIWWPNYYQMGSEHIEFKGDKLSLLTKEDAAFLLDYVQSASKEPAGNELLCNIQIQVVDNQVHTTVHCEIYDDYPEGNDKFVEIINKICGGDKEYLCMNGNIQTVTQEYFASCTGYSDEDIPGGTINDVLNQFEFNDAYGFQFRFLSINYKKILDNYELCKYLPYSVHSAPSSDEECMEFANNLANELNTSGNVEKINGEEGNPDWYQIGDYNGISLRVYKTEDVAGNIHQDTWRRSNYDCLVYYEPYEGCGDASRFDTYCFIYSKDYKFVVALEPNSNDEIEIFKEIGSVLIDM